MVDEETDVLIVGGGPAGMMAGLLFARAGVERSCSKSMTTSSAIFAATRSIPRRLQIFARTGHARPIPCAAARPGAAPERDHWSARSSAIGGLQRACKVAAPFIALMPQWEFLDFSARRGAALSLLCARDEDRGDQAGRRRWPRRWSGCRREWKQTNDPQPLVLLPTVVVRWCASEAALPLEDLGAPMDVFWFRAVEAAHARQAVDGVIRHRPAGRADRPRRLLAVRLSSFPKGAAEALRARGLENFRAGRRPDRAFPRRFGR